LSPISSGETLSAATSSSAKLEKYQIIVTSVGSSPYTLYQTVPVANVTTVDTTNKQITVLNANNMTANIISTIDYTLASGNPAKTKSIVYESSTIQTSGVNQLIQMESLFIRPMVKQLLKLITSLKLLMNYNHFMCQMFIS
jgi:hypothetical protein